MKIKTIYLTIIVVMIYSSLYVYLRKSHVLYHQLWWDGASEWNSVMHLHEIRPNDEIGYAEGAYIIFYPFCFMESSLCNNRDPKYRKNEKIEDYITDKKQRPKEWFMEPAAGK